MNGMDWLKSIDLSLAQNNESWKNHVVGSNYSREEIKQLSEDLCDFVIWTTDYVYFSMFHHEDEEWIAFVERNPDSSMTFNKSPNLNKIENHPLHNAIEIKWGEFG
jgi:hypothetical protein